MNELATEEMQSSEELIRQEASGCPLQSMHTQRTVLDADDEFVFTKHKRVVTQDSTDASGAAELHLYYGEKEISFDKPGLFAFGETLAKQSRFVARTATTWGNALVFFHLHIKSGQIYLLPTARSTADRSSGISLSKEKAS